jgi:hypothetical protein
VEEGSILMGARICACFVKSPMHFTAATSESETGPIWRVFLQLRLRKKYSRLPIIQVLHKKFLAEEF